MSNGVKSIQDLEAEKQAELANLTGVEAKLLALHDEEHEIRTRLQHLEIQLTRVLAGASIQ